MKNNFCLFESPLIQKKAVFFSNIFFRFRDINVFLLCKLDHGVKFQEHCFNISRDIVFSAFYDF